MWADEPALDEATRRLDDWGVDREQGGPSEGAVFAGAGDEGHGDQPRSDDPGHRRLVGPAGRPALDERGRQHSAAHTARQILETTRAAHTDLLSRITEAATGVLGVEDPTAAALVESYRRRLDTDRGTPVARG
ncbi:YbaB/EbfC family DNA-binding protein [Micromonospora sp. URMC 106]|uniref:YbaB/EbfC family DNA-binding protein n=1 Tax=Micromonospora sp. URMC 106 TaxID=3423408 RepID=UPI003F19F55A